jgi:hypothetical protein
VFGVAPELCKIRRVWLPDSAKSRRKGVLKKSKTPARMLALQDWAKNYPTNIIRLKYIFVKQPEKKSAERALRKSEAAKQLSGNRLVKSIAC